MVDCNNSLGHAAGRLGEYMVTKDIAEGTFGKVKMAKHVLTGQKVAMKYLSKDAINTSGTKTRVLREVQYMRILQHAHIVKLYEVISTPTHIIIVLEYVGDELFNYIVKYGKMAEPQARRFFQQLMSGIDYSHRLKIVHRDLKPENVLLDDQLNVKIADFGLSNVVTDGEFLVTSCGSPNYAAPEVIRGLRYTGPEIDVWSCGVILYVMLCGRLPFEDDDVNVLFAKITKGVYHEPCHLSHDAKDLVARMLAVDPVKRITVPDILRSSFYTFNLPRYLKPIPPLPGPVVGTLSSLASPAKPLPFEYIEGLGRINVDIVRELADSMDGVSVDNVWEALRLDEGVQGNAVKVAYMLLRDKRRSGRDLAVYEDEEREAQLAAMDVRDLPLCRDVHPLITLQPANNRSPLALSPAGVDAEVDPFDQTFTDDDDDDDDNDDGIEDGMSWERPPPPESHFAVLPSSLPGNAFVPAPSNPRHLSGRDKKPRNPKWHFGIRSRSPRMEVMLEIYRTLQALGMEWKEKMSLGGLGGVRTRSETLKIERRHDMDGKSLDQATFDSKVASSVYFVETRARTDDVVILMDLQLYQVDEDNYLVDFKHQGYYKASTQPGAMKFDRAPSPPPSTASSRGSTHSADGEHRQQDREEFDSTVSPFLFMDTACRLILELAGGGENTPTNANGDST
ncbi:kinase-like domain-containing protein [Gautieria morchelliformis]|nr:kinase-like domain-containing protein [Gautieria morchelliformis]